MSRLKNLYHTTCRNRILEEKTTGKSMKLQMWTRKMERERYCELIECNMVICFFSWSLIQNHFPHKMHRIDLPCKVLRASALLCWAHLLSRWRALFLLRAAAAAPGLALADTASFKKMNILFEWIFWIFTEWIIFWTNILVLVCPCHKLLSINVSKSSEIIQGSLMGPNSVHFRGSFTYTGASGRLRSHILASFWNFE